MAVVQIKPQFDCLPALTTKFFNAKRGQSFWEKTEHAEESQLRLGSTEIALRPRAPTIADSGAAVGEANMANQGGSWIRLVIGHGDLS